MSSPLPFSDRSSNHFGMAVDTFSIPYSMIRSFKDFAKP